jgi:hypothetical protein
VWEKKTKKLAAHTILARFQHHVIEGLPHDNLHRLIICFRNFIRLYMWLQLSILLTTTKNEVTAPV